MGHGKVRYHLRIYIKWVGVALVFKHSSYVTFKPAYASLRRLMDFLRAEASNPYLIIRLICLVITAWLYVWA